MKPRRRKKAYSASMLEYFYFSAFVICAAICTNLLKCLVGALLEEVGCYFSSCSDIYKVKELYNKLLSAEKKEHPHLEVLTVIILGVAYLIGNYIFIDGILRITPLFYMLLAYFISGKLFMLLEKLFRAIIAVWIIVLASPMLFLSIFIKKIAKI